MSTMLCDAHNHLQDRWLAPCRAQILSDLHDIGLDRAVVNGTTEADWSEVAALAAAHPWIIPSYGLHPWFIAERPAHWQETLLAHVEAGSCGIGEIGLDRWKEPFDFADQIEVFLWQLALAAKSNRPVTIHCLKAWGKLEELVRAELVPERGFLLHAYGGPAEMVPALVSRGAYFSFSGYFLHDRQESRREVFKHLPMDRLLIETDAPAMPLPPEATRFPLPSSPEGRPVNHPANLVAVYEALAELRQVALEDLSRQVAANFSRLFGG